MSQSMNNVPIAIPIVEPTNEDIKNVLNNNFKNINKNLQTILNNNINVNIQDSVSALDKIKNKLELQHTLYDYKVSNFLSHVDKFNNRMDQLQTSLDDINKKMTPIKKLADGTISSSEIKASTEAKESKFKQELELAKLRAQNEKISIWVALEKNKNESLEKNQREKNLLEKKYQEGLLVGSFGASLLFLIGLNFKSKL